MSDRPQKSVDLALTPGDAPVIRYETPHGILRTGLYTSEKVESPALHCQIRYDDNHMVLVYVQGKKSVEIGTAFCEWLWQNLSEADNPRQFGEQWNKYLQKEARELNTGRSPHTFIVSLLNRGTEEGELWVSWLGTSSFRLYDEHRNPLPVEMGLEPGEAWSSEDGVMPAPSRPHNYTVAINRVHRFLIYSGSLRLYVDEIPYLGRASVQRVVEAAGTDRGMAALFDLTPYQAGPLPETPVLRYRWETPYEVTLRWDKVQNATGYRVEQADNLEFENAEILAEMMDARQLLYRVQPPVDQDIYYRIVPINRNQVGVPGKPVIVTPVSLVPPVIEHVTWISNGLMLVRWSDIPQANRYELEVSPESDFDSPQTETLYTGEEITLEFDPGYRRGWYLRVRCLNTLFAPYDASLWSVVAPIPNRLQTPKFEGVTPQRVSWKPVPGAATYEVRRMIAVNEYRPFTSVKTPYFTPPVGQGGLYEVRALREAADEKTASLWSEGVAVGDWVVEDEGATQKFVTDELSAAATPPTMDSDTYEVPTLQKKPGRPITWPVIAAIVGIVLFLGLLIGMLGEQRLGILSDATATPIPRNVLNQTATGQAARAATATTVWEDRSRFEALSDEQRNAIATQDSQIDTLNTSLNALATVQAQAEMDITALSATRDAIENNLLNANEQIDILNETLSAIEAERDEAREQGTMVSSTLEAVIEERNQAYEQSTAIAETLSGVEADLDRANTAIDMWEAEYSTLEAERADAVQTYEAQQTEIAELETTIEYQSELLTPTATPTPSATPTPTATPTPSPTDEAQFLQAACEEFSADEARNVDTITEGEGFTLYWFALPESISGVTYKVELFDADRRVIEADVTDNKYQFDADALPSAGFYRWLVTIYRDGEQLCDRQIDGRLQIEEG